MEIQRLESRQPIDRQQIEKCLSLHSFVSIDEVEAARQHCVTSINLSSKTNMSRAERLKKAIALLDGTLAPYERCVVSMDTTLEHPATIEEQRAVETAIREIMPHNPQIKWHFHMVDAVLPDLSGMIAETVDVGVAVAEIDMIHFLIHEEGHVRTPGKT